MPPTSASDALADPLGPRAARFRADLLALSGRAPAPDAPLALAVSGGPDSMAMLALAHAAFPGAVVAATVDHRLRAASADEAAMVAQACAALGVPHWVLVPASPIKGASIQAKARETRYFLLEHWAAEVRGCALLTAHHADDQAETFLMRAARGSGVAGLAAIRDRRELGANGLNLLRPLLDWRRAELRDLAVAAGLPFVDDPSNADDRHDRTRFRALLANNVELDVRALAAAARYAAEAEATLAALADRFWAERAAVAADEIRLEIVDLPREIRRRLVRRAIREMRSRAGITTPAFPDGANIEALLDQLENASGGTHAGIEARTRATFATFRMSPPRRSL
ncbi:tRNA lysidine(34) synthetase TilS [Sphingomonas sp. JC676]|uniref:tRNA lysidine(34) synthetase TilS n=1 Tax=Sphingomonas sp. JC676 TaxID=2768065 RepID=UPI00165848FD|nr:tRNA lysidine(34) synthetase TilS [Sphingomonas sp. JC676]MBC9034714.1 tRNA lysidine(34) synthetase TilS [Sphingomonas sp. JC676]